MFSTYMASINGGTKLMLRTRGGDLSIAREVFELRDYEKYFRLQEGQTIIDVGAHIGCFTIRAAQIVGREGKVFSFEPSSENFSFLRKNIAINGLHNVEAFNCALSGEDRPDAELYISKSSGSNSLFMRKGKGMECTKPERVPLRTLDSMVQQAKLSRVDILKLDAEGSELAILRGGKDTISRFHPNITGEAHPSFSDSGQSILDYLARFGYNGKVDGNAQRVELFNSWWGEGF